MSGERLADALQGAAKGVLDRHGWTLRPESRARFSVVRARDGRVLSELAVEEPEGAAKAITPSIRLRARPGAGRRTAEEKAGLEELTGALTLLLESRLGGGREKAWTVAENHADWTGLNGPGAEELILRTTYACSQRCPFCFIPLTGQAVPDAALEAELDSLAARKNARGELTISGGEPAADSRLSSVLASARRRGFRRFILQTNAVFLARAGLAQKLVDLGVASFLVSFHSHKPASYNLITGSRGQFPLAEAGLKRILQCAPAPSVTVNIVVNAWNYEDLPEHMSYLARLSAGAPPPRIFFSVINEVGHERAPGTAVDFSRVAPFLRGALERCRLEGLEVERFAGESAFPLCLIGVAERGALAARGPLPQERVRYGEGRPAEGGAIGRLKRRSCRGCPFDAKCLGVAATYARLFGLAALEVPA